MVFSLVYALLRVLLDVFATSHGDRAKLQAEVLALQRQVEVLERQIKRAHWTPGDRVVMAALHDRLPQSAWAGLLVKPETVLGWHRKLVRRKWAAYRGRPRRGRPPITAECRDLIIRRAEDNPGWGYFRIRAELLTVLVAAGIPQSGRRAQLSWKQFLAAHAQTLVAADFFSVDTVFFKRLHVLIYMNLATRRVLLASCTTEPNEACVTQQARNLSWRLEEDGIKLSVAIHDRDKKFATRCRPGIQVGRRPGDLDPADSTRRECTLRALDPELPARMHGLGAGRFRAPLASSSRCLLQALQQRAAASQLRLVATRDSR